MEFLFEQIAECEELRETITSLKQQLSEAQELRHSSPLNIPSQHHLESRTLHEELLNVKEGSALKYTKQTFLLQTQVINGSLI